MEFENWEGSAISRDFFFFFFKKNMGHEEAEPEKAVSLMKHSPQQSLNNLVLNVLIFSSAVRFCLVSKLSPLLL